MELQSNSENTIYNELQDSLHFNNVILESSPDCLKVLDVEGRLQFMNFNGLCQMEIDDFSGFKNQFWWDLWGKENEQLVKDAVKKALGGEATEFSAFCATAKGTPKWWHVTITPVASADNQITQLLSVSRDITAQKKTEQEILHLNNLLEEKVRIRTEELLEKNIQLEKTNKQLAVYNYIACHDLQEPLRKIQMFSNKILNMKGNFEELDYSLERIIVASDRMRSLLDSLNKYASLKDFKFTFESCDLNAIIQDVIEYSQDTIITKNAQIKATQLPVILGSKVLLTQLFINLLGNALKFSKSSTPPLISFSYDIVTKKEIPYSLKTNCHELYSIKITDNGVGFENIYRHQIFEAYKKLQNDNSLTGTGIGLAICKTIVENHDGWIDATSNPEEGSTFTIYFPKYDLSKL